MAALSLGSSFRLCVDIDSAAEPFRRLLQVAKVCEKCGIKIRNGRLCQTCGKYKRLGGVWHPLPPYGEVVYDDDGKPICHVCGMALDKLIEHTKRKHGLDSAAYRAEFGLMRKNARLTSPKYSDKMKDHVEDKPTWKRNFEAIHTGAEPCGRRNPHWSQQEINSRHDQQVEKSHKRWKRSSVKPAGDV